MGPERNTTEGLKKRIFDLVREYYELAHRERPFIPGETKVPYAGRVFDDREMVNLVDSALDFWLTAGPVSEEFERRMRDRFGAQDFALVNSGSSANLVIVSALTSEQLDRPLGPGDEVITPAVTFPTTLTPLLQHGLVPVFVDAEVGTYNINPKKLEGAISDRTRALFLPHTLGNPCDMELVMDLARRHELVVVEDCCDALGSTFDGRPVGTFGDLASLSFYPAHHITLGEGGGVIINRPELARTVRSIRDWGRDCWCAPGYSNTCGKRFGWKLGGLPFGYDHKYIFSHRGYNLKVTEMQAAVGLAQLDKIDDFVARRRANFTKLYAGLSAFEEFLVLPSWDPRAEPSWWAFPLTVRPRVDRAALVRWLEGGKIETRLLFGGNILRQPAFLSIRCRVFEDLEESDRIMRDTFFIGVYPGLRDEMIAYVIDRFAEYFRRFSHRP